MKRASSSRGRPLIALGALLGTWVAARIVLYDASVVPLAVEIPRTAATQERVYGAGTPRPMGMLSPVGEGAGKVISATQRGAPAAAADRNSVRSLPPAILQAPGVPQRATLPAQQPWKWDRIPAPERDPVPRPIPVQTAAAHQIMWMAALSHMPVPQDTREAPQFMPSAPFYASGREPRARESRWSADAWLFLRRGGDRRFAGGASSATYGASQAGAVVRYSLGRRSPHRPAAYLRATTALSGATEREAAVGISARPLPGVPVRAAAELRASDQAGKTRARPAAMAVTEVQPFDLPAETRGEFYAQAGYVGGRFKTAFVDGQLRFDRKAVTLGTATVRAGGGAWGGAQKGASRLDVGPTATVSVAVGDTAAARVGVDWRFRVAGDARPKSGPALTISAGF